MLKDELEIYLNDLTQHAAVETVKNHKLTLQPFVEKYQHRSITSADLAAQMGAAYLTETSSRYSSATLRARISILANFIGYVQNTDPASIRVTIQYILDEQGQIQTGKQNSTSEDSEAIEDLKTAVNMYSHRFVLKLLIQAGVRPRTATEIAHIVSDEEKFEDDNSI